MNRYRLAWACVGLWALIVLFAGLGALPFTDRDEGEYATVAQNMNRFGDWVIPQVNGRPYYEKPALFFWAVAGSFRAFGETEAAGRAPSAVSGLLLAGLLAWFGRRLGGDRLGLLAAAMTLTSLMFVMLARVVLVDMMLTLFTTACLIAFYTGYTAHRGPDRWWFMAGWAAMGLAFLTKGPVGVAGPVLALVPLAAFDRNLWTTLKRIHIPLGLLVFVIVAGPWYVMALLRDGLDFYQGFFVSQNVRRYTEVLLGHGPPVWYYLPILAAMVWPWFFFALPAGWRALRAGRAARREDPLIHLDFFLALWFLSNLLLVSISATKLPHYVFPAVPAVILLSARFWQKRLDGGAWPQGWRKYTLFGAAGVVAVVLALALLMAPFLAPYALEQAAAGVNPDSFEYALTNAPPDLGWGTPLTAALFGGAAVLGAVWGLKGFRGRSLASFTAAAGVFILGLNFLIAPAVFNYLQTPARTMARRMLEQKSPGDRVAAFGLYKPTLWFYTRDGIERVRSDELDQLARTLASEDRVFMLSRRRLLPLLDQRPRFRLLGRFGGYVLGDNQSGEAPPGE